MREASTFEIASDSPPHCVALSAKALKEKNIILTGRADFLRVSPHFYNTESDLDRVLAQL